MKNHFRTFSGFAITLRLQIILVAIKTMVDQLSQKANFFTNGPQTKIWKIRDYFHSQTRQSGFSATSLKISILEHMLLHKLYINVVPVLAVILLYRTRLYDLQEPR